ncbi:MAG: hypothetical protein ABIY55_19595 [Kofleriaceae bacterium]
MRSPAVGRRTPHAKRIAMAQTRDEASPSRIELVVLACLSQPKPPSDAELGDAVRELAAPLDPADATRARAAEMLATAARRGWAAADRKLTDSGKRVLRNAFQLARTPTWGQVRDKHFPSLALGVTPGSDSAKAACTETAMMAAVLGARFDVRGARTPVAVCDALIAKALGMPAGKLTLDRMRAHVLARGINGKAADVPTPVAKKSYAPRLAAWIACSAVGASGPARNKVARALARRWVRQEPDLLGAAAVPAATPPAAAPPATPDAILVVTPPIERAPDLLAAVRDTIPRIGNDGRFGEKVYVSAIWRTITRDSKAGDLSLDYFKRWLLGANRDGQLVLARADLIGAMDAKQVTESEINDRGATFHFVLDQRNGASRSQRENHAG